MSAIEGCNDDFQVTDIRRAWGENTLVGRHSETIGQSYHPIPCLLELGNGVRQYLVAEGEMRPKLAFSELNNLRRSS